jgi:hypothetical protein
VTLWSVTVLASASALGGALWLGPGIVRGTLRQLHLVVREGGGSDHVLDQIDEASLAAISAGLERVSDVGLPWALVTTLVAVALLVTSVGFVAGQDAARRRVRFLLCALVVGVTAGAAHASVVLLPDPDSWTAAVQKTGVLLSRGAVLLELSREEFVAEDIASYTSPTILGSTAWGLAALTLAVSGTLFLASGRARVRSWCAARGRPVASPPTEG